MGASSTKYIEANDAMKLAVSALFKATDEELARVLDILIGEKRLLDFHVGYTSGGDMDYTPGEFD